MEYRVYYIRGCEIGSAMDQLVDSLYDYVVIRSVLISYYLDKAEKLSRLLEIENL